jgi:hypothetical protein
VYIEPPESFKIYLAAAIAKREFLSMSSRTNAKPPTFSRRHRFRSSGNRRAAKSHVAYLPFAPRLKVGVLQLIEGSSNKLLGAYSVNKQRGGGKNQQSMAQAVTERFKEFVKE